MAQAISSKAGQKRRAEAAPATTEWRRRSYLRVRRPVWAASATAGSKKR